MKDRKPGIVEKFDGRLWGVRAGAGVTYIYWLRPRDFLFSRPIETGLQVELFYEPLPHSGLWKAIERVSSDCEQEQRK